MPRYNPRQHTFSYTLIHPDNSPSHTPPVDALLQWAYYEANALIKQYGDLLEGVNGYLGTGAYIYQHLLSMHRILSTYSIYTPYLHFPLRSITTVATLHHATESNPNPNPNPNPYYCYCYCCCCCYAAPCDRV